MTAAEAHDLAVQSSNYKPRSNDNKILRDSLIQSLEADILVAARAGLTTLYHTTVIHPSHAKDYFMEKGYLYSYGSLIPQVYFIKMSW